jgi:hypothetical protein
MTAGGMKTAACWPPMGYEMLWSIAALALPSRLSHAEALAALHALAAQHGYTPFDPFTGMPGMARATPDAIRAFVLPAAAGGRWCVVLGEAWPALPEAWLRALSAHGPVAALALHAERAEARAWQDGGEVAFAVAFGHDLDHEAAHAPEQAASADPLLAALPPEIQALNTHPQRASRLIEQLGAQALARAGNAQASDEARALLARRPPDWSSTDGRRLAALCHALGLPGAAQPAFVAVRDACQLARRRQRRPDAELLPGDADTLAAVPDALDYPLVYFSRKA